MGRRRFIHGTQSDIERNKRGEGSSKLEGRVESDEESECDRWEESEDRTRPAEEERNTDGDQQVG